MQELIDELYKTRKEKIVMNHNLGELKLELKLQFSKRYTELFKREKALPEYRHSLPRYHDVLYLVNLVPEIRELRQQIHQLSFEYDLCRNKCSQLNNILQLKKGK